ncbi:MAG TPA: hypothetical protein VFV52_02425 [Bacilli bacterium]|nr:hypothetical protein [Bacilli bacterium]
MRKGILLLALSFCLTMVATTTVYGAAEEWGTGDILPPQHSQ